jgi:hypothetical protein
MLEAVGSWYCVDHLEEGIIDVVLFVANVRGWDPEKSADAIDEWLAQ